MAERRRVVHLTTSHVWDDTRVFWKECRSLADAGFEVSLVVPDGGAPRTVDGVEIRPVPLPRSAVGRLVRTPWQAYRAARATRAAVYHFHDPELLLAGVALRRGGAQVVYDSHEDLVRKVSGREWMPGWLARPTSRALGAIERLLASRVDLVVSAEPGGASRFPAGCVVVQNYALDGELAPAVGHDPVPAAPPLAVYVGAVGRHRGAVEMVRAIGAVPAAARPRLTVAGPCPAPLAAELQAVASGAGVDLVMPGRVDRSQVAALLAQATLGFALFHPIAQYAEATQPVKLFEYMAAGVPVVASDFPAFRGIVADHGAGLLVDPLDPAAVAGAVEWLVAHPGDAAEMGRRGRAAVLDHYSWSSQARVLVDAYRRLAA